MMLQNANSLNLESAYLFKKGKNNKFVSYDDCGKVIIADNCVKSGYYMITDILKNLKTCYVVTVSDEVLVDYYYGMTYDQLKDLLMNRGYTIACEIPFNNPYIKSLPSTEYQMVAYNSKLNIVIIAETFSTYSDHIFNSIDCYCYGTSTFDHMRSLFMSRGDSKLVVFDIASYRNETYIKPLEFVESSASEHAYKGSFDLPSCYTYGDDISVYKDIDKCRSRFLSFIPEDLKAWFRI